jgi:hypothetical protein
MHLRWGLVVALVATAVSACGLDVYTLGGDGTGDDVQDDGGIDDDGGGGNGDGGTDDAVPPDACVAFPETCDGTDDDCDGETDEGFDLTMDPANCGGCGNRCAQPNAAGTCVDSDCEYECLPGFVDLDGDVTNGCDYFCSVTNGGVEICDISDNDCDGDTDEGLDLDNDELNCGTCGNHCLALNAEPICDMGDCTFGACDPGFADVIPAIAGCEYACPVDPAVAEDCDGVDDDCDGVVDDLPIPGLGADCADPGFELNLGVGRCTPGVLACSFGVEVCQGFVRPLFDDSACNTVDDDCDGPIDEDVDFTDPRHCGTCANVCNLANAIEGCVAGGCTVVACLPGFVDEDGDDSNGCEYGCTPTGPETCDGLDNDCDGEFDLDDGDLNAPSNFCEMLGECAGTMPTCAADPCGGGVGWTCAYGGDAEVDVCGDLAFQETECDDLDNDCDGQTDESYVALGDDCDDDGIGVCRRTGEMVCATTQDALECDLTSPVVPPSPEECDNEDDDCDTFVDEDAPDDMVAVSNGATTYYMYTYEASRPDADDNGFGNANHRACSKPGVLPWRSVTHTEAAAACLAAGKRLCTEAEWELSCGGASGFDFPYGNSYDADACNGRDVDLDCTAPDSDEVALTGEAFGCPAPAVSECVSPTGAYDLSGNLREWTSTPVGGSAFRVRGGGFDNIDEGLRCDFSFIAFAPGSAFPNLGFRCCADTPDP